MAYDETSEQNSTLRKRGLLDGFSTAGEWKLRTLRDHDSAQVWGVQLLCWADDTFSRLYVRQLSGSH